MDEWHGILLLPVTPATPELLCCVAFLTKKSTLEEGSLVMPLLEEVFIFDAIRTPLGR